MSKAMNDCHYRVSSKLGTYAVRSTQPQKAPERPWLAHTAEDSSKTLNQTVKFFFRAQISGFCALCTHEER